MRIFVAGASGTLGRPVVRRLARAGHDVVGTTRRRERLAAIESDGGRGVVVDALDPGALAAAVGAARPEALVHLLTALPPGGARRDADLQATNRLRTEGTANLLAAARAHGVARVVAESFVLAIGFGDHGTRPRTEDDPLGERGKVPERRWAVVEALRVLEREVTAAGGIALRFGMLRGEGVPSIRHLHDALRARKLPIVGAGTALGSWVALADAAEAVRLAVERASPGRIVHVADDAAIPWGRFLREEAQRIGAPPPRVLPAWFVRLVAPSAADFLSTSIALSNARAKAELGWSPSGA